MWNKVWNYIARPHIWQQVLISGLIAGIVFAVESRSAEGAYHASGWQMAAISALSAFLAVLAFGLAGRLKDDYRPHVAERAKAARAVAVALLLIPTCFLGASLKMENLERRYAAYIESAEYTADVALAAQARLPLHEQTADPWDISEAARRTTRPVTPDLNIFDVEFWMAAFFQGVLVFASDALRVPAPMTEGERRSVAAKIGAANRGSKPKVGSADKAEARRERRRKRRELKLLQGGRA